MSKAGSRHADLTERHYYRDASIISQAAKTLGKHDDAQHYAELAENIKDAFNKKWLNPDTNQYALGSPMPVTLRSCSDCAAYECGHGAEGIQIDLQAPLRISRPNGAPYRSPGQGRHDRRPGLDRLPRDRSPEGAN